MNSQPTHDYLLWTYPQQKAKYSEQIQAIEQASVRLVNQTNWAEFTEQLKRRVAEGESIASVLPEAFAAVREVASREVGLRHYPEQLVGGMLLSEGYAIEMATGEGKTLVATLPAYLNAIAGDRSFVITVNDYLARRDMEWMGPVYRKLGLSVGLVTSYHGRSAYYKKYSYGSDVVYVTNHELVWDYLRDNMAYQRGAQCLPELSCAIIDEVDLVLLDEACVPFIISGDDISQVGSWGEAVALAQAANEGEEDGYEYLPRERQVKISDALYDRMYAKALAGKSESETLDELDTGKLATFCQQVQLALIAKHMTEEDDFLIKDGKVDLIDRDSGRIQAGRRLSDGLHEALEAIHGLATGSPSSTVAKISYQEFFKLFRKRCGMTGTARQVAEELYKVYNLPSAGVRTHKPEIRELGRDRVYQTGQQKLRAAALRVAELHKARKPVLVGGPSAREIGELRALLRAQGVSDSQIATLSARHIAHEARTIGEAGRPGRITIATNLAGRGTDIVLGGDPGLDDVGLPKGEDLHKDGDGASERRTGEEPSGHAARAQLVKSLGGLHVILLQRQASARRDRQFIGRCARQGDPGYAEAFVSMDDDLMQGHPNFRFNGIGQLEVAESVLYDEFVNRKQQANERVDYDRRVFVQTVDRSLGYARSAFLLLRNSILRLDVDWELFVSENVKHWSSPADYADFESELGYLWHFPGLWLAQAVELVEESVTATDDSMDTIIPRVRQAFGDSVAESYCQLGREEPGEDDLTLVLRAVRHQVIHQLQRYVPSESKAKPNLAAEFVKLAAISSLDLQWRKLLDEYEFQQDAMRIRAITARENVFQRFERERRDAFDEHLRAATQLFTEILLRGVPTTRSVSYPERSQLSPFGRHNWETG